MNIKSKRDRKSNFKLGVKDRLLGGCLMLLSRHISIDGIIIFLWKISSNQEQVITDAFSILSQSYFSEDRNLVLENIKAIFIHSSTYEWDFAFFNTKCIVVKNNQMLANNSVYLCSFLIRWAYAINSNYNFYFHKCIMKQIIFLNYFDSPEICIIKKDLINRYIVECKK